MNCGLERIHRSKLRSLIYIVKSVCASCQCALLTFCASYTLNSQERNNLSNRLLALIEFQAVITFQTSLITWKILIEHIAR